MLTGMVSKWCHTYE